MTHTLHRRGSVSELSKDFVVLAMAARGINREGAAPKLAKVLEIYSRHNPVIYGNVAGNSIRSTLPYMLENTKDNTVSHAVFRSEEDLVDVLEELKEADLGISIVVSGLFDHVGQCCKVAGLKPHTVNMSLGVFGKKDLLPPEDILQIETMCGHNMIGVPLIEDKIQKIRAGRLSPEIAAKQMARNCHCGIFNWERAARILRRIVEKETTI